MDAAHDLEVAALVRGALGAIKGADQVIRRIVDEVYGDAGGSVVLAVCKISRPMNVQHEFGTPDQSMKCADSLPAISLLRRRRRASMASVQLGGVAEKQQWKDKERLTTRRKRVL